MVASPEALDSERGAIGRDDRDRDDDDREDGDVETEVAVRARTPLKSPVSAGDGAGVLYVLGVGAEGATRSSVAGEGDSWGPISKMLNRGS